MNLTVKRVREWYELHLQEGNTVVESGLLDEKEYNEKIIQILSEFLYYDTEKIIDYLVSECKEDILNRLEEEGMSFVESE